MSVFEKIEAQQKGKENSPEWMVGEQLKEICRDPECAEQVEKDLEAVPLKEAAGKIKAWADAEHAKRKGNCICVPPNVAERIIREAYGLPAAESQQKPANPDDAAAISQQEKPDDFLNLEDFL